MTYEIVTYAHVSDDQAEHIVANMRKFFARRNEALANPWPDLAFKPRGNDGGALVYRAHLIGQTEWSVAARCLAR